MAYNAAQLDADIRRKIDEFARRGYRALGACVGARTSPPSPEPALSPPCRCAVGLRRAGVARSNSGDLPADQCDWEMVGLLPLYDPPRHDCIDTIRSETCRPGPGPAPARRADPAARRSAGRRAAAPGAGPPSRSASASR